MTTSERFAARLRELREARGLTQQQLADHVGVQREAVARWEAGGAEPKWSAVLALAEALSADCIAFTQTPATEEKRPVGRPKKENEKRQEGGPMETVQSKVDCQMTVKGQPIEVMLHLIEVRYSDRVVFWNGVWQITTDQARRVGVLGEESVKVGVKLSDGRSGFFLVTHGRVTSEYFEMAGVGKPN